MKFKLTAVSLVLASMSVGAQSVNTGPIDVLPPLEGVVMNPVFGAPPPLDGTTVNPPTAGNCPTLGCGDTKTITKVPVDTPPPPSSTNDEPIKVVSAPNSTPVAVVETPRVIPVAPVIPVVPVAPVILGGIHTASLATLPQTTQRLGQTVQSRMDSDLMTGKNAWGDVVYQRGERSSNDGVSGFNSNLYQLVLGTDAYTDAVSGLKLGAGLALSNTMVNTNGGSSTIQQGSLFVYGKMPVLQDYVLDSIVSVGMSSTNLSRGNFSNKSVMGNDAMVSVGISRPFAYNEVQITPYARVSYQYLGQDSYNEGKADGAMSVGSFNGNAVRGVVGVAVGSLNKDPLKSDYTYRANIGVGADTQGLLNPTVNATVGGYTNSVTTATAGSTFVQVSLYGTAKVADNAYAYAGVSSETRSGQTLYGGMVGFRMAF